MADHNNTYRLSIVLAALFMMLALLWLTVSLPFVSACEQAAQQWVKQMAEGPDEEGSNPFGNSTEEKTESSNSLSEYVHESYTPVQPAALVQRFYKCYPSNIYFSYHPELISPPPEA